MMSSQNERRAAEHAAELEAPLQALELQLRALGLALRDQDADAVDAAAAGLHTTLAVTLDHFARANRHGSVPPVLRQRLALAGGQVAAQREALARATASLDRAIDVLIPGLAPVQLYSAAGSAARASGQGGSLLA
jgi:hypothetical protein